MNLNKGHNLVTVWHVSCFKTWTRVWGMWYSNISNANWGDKEGLKGLLGEREAHSVKRGAQVHAPSTLFRSACANKFTWQPRHLRNRRHSSTAGCFPFCLSRHPLTCLRVARLLHSGLPARKLAAGSRFSLEQSKLPTAAALSDIGEFPISENWEGMTSGEAEGGTSAAVCGWGLAGGGRRRRRVSWRWEKPGKRVRRSEVNVG